MLIPNEKYFLQIGLNGTERRAIKRKKVSPHGCENTGKYSLSGKAAAFEAFVPFSNAPLRCRRSNGYISAILRTVFAVRIVKRPPMGALAVLGHQFVF